MTNAKKENTSVQTVSLYHQLPWSACDARSLQSQDQAKTESFPMSSKVLICTAIFQRSRENTRQIILC